MSDDWHGDWAAAARSARFPVFGAFIDGGVMRSGGWGGDPGEVRHVSVATMVDDDEISVDTSVPDRVPGFDLRPRFRVYDVLHGPVLREEPLELPLTITVVADDRDITVDRTERTFTGVRVDGESLWVGECDLGDVLIVVRTTVTRTFRLERLDDLDAVVRRPGPRGQRSW